LAENDETHYVAYVSEQNLLPDTSGEPVEHPTISELFADFDGKSYMRKPDIKLN
jgi:heat shock protein HspQ